MAFRDRLKQYKLVHWIHNLIHYKSLLHNKAAYERYHLHKPVIASISSKDFPDKESRAWLDTGHSAELVRTKEKFSDFGRDEQEQLVSWSDKGYIILDRFIDESSVQGILKEIEHLVSRHKLHPTHDHKLMFANRISPEIRKITVDKRLIALLSFILDKEVVPFQTINFIQGSNQRAHSDSIHMTTYPLGYLIAVWVALEDTNMDNGPLFYYPGSHRLPYLLNGDFNEGETALALGKKVYTDYEDRLENRSWNRGLKKRSFSQKRGTYLSGTPTSSMAACRCWIPRSPGRAWSYIIMPAMSSNIMRSRRDRRCCNKKYRLGSIFLLS